MVLGIPIIKKVCRLDQCHECTGVTQATLLEKKPMLWQRIPHFSNRKIIPQYENCRASPEQTTNNGPRITQPYPCCKIAAVRRWKPLFDPEYKSPCACRKSVVLREHEATYSHLRFSRDCISASCLRMLIYVRAV